MSSSRWRPSGNPDGRRIVAVALPQPGPAGVEIAQIISGTERIPVVAPRTAQEIAAAVRIARTAPLGVVLPSAGDSLLPVFVPSRVVALFASSPGPDKLMMAGRAITAGEVYADPELAGALLTLARRTTRAVDPSDQLSDREIAVMELLAEGLSNRIIASRLFVSEHTVRNHLHRIYRKLGVGTRQEAIRVFRASTRSDDDTAPVLNV